MAFALLVVGLTVALTPRVQTYPDHNSSKWIEASLKDLESCGFVLYDPMRARGNTGPRTRYTYAEIVNSAVVYLGGCTEVMVNPSLLDRPKPIGIDPAAWARYTEPVRDPKHRIAFRNAALRFVPELDRLMTEFSKELASLGVDVPYEHRKVKEYLATIIAVAPTDPDAKPFPDAPANHWAAKAVWNLRQEGVVNGYPDQTFNGIK